MKNIFNTLVTLAAVIGMAASCDVVKLGEEDTYKPGEPDVEGCYGVYFPTQDLSKYATLDPSDPTVVTVTVGRSVAKGSVTVTPEIVCDSIGVFTADPIVFEDGQEETTIDVTFPNAVIGTTYSCTLQVKGDQFVSKYSTSPSFLTFNVTRVKWELLGMARWRDDIVGSLYGSKAYSEVEDVEVYQRPDKPGYYKFKSPYGPNMTSKIFTALIKSPITPEQVKDNCEEVDFFIDATNPAKVFIPNQSLGVTISSSDGVLSVGSYCPEGGYKGGTSYGTLKDKIITFPVKGLIISASWYGNMDGLTRICLPGAVLTDYTIKSVETDFSVDGVTPISVTAGKDVEKISYSCVEGELDDAAAAKLAGLIHTKAEGVIITENDDYVYDATNEVTYYDFGLQFDKTGVHTIVIVSEAENGAYEYDYASFNHVTAADAPTYATNISCFMEATPARYEGYDEYSSFAFGISGKDIVAVRATVIEAKYVESYGLDYMKNYVKNSKTLAFSDAEVAKVNGVGGYYVASKGFKDGTAYNLIVWASNGITEGYAIAEWTTTKFPEVWKPIGKASYTEDFIASFYIRKESACVTYDVDVEASETIPGRYRLKNPYGAAYPYNEPGDYDTTEDHYMVINAQDTTLVNIETHMSGCCWNATYGEFVMTSMAYELLQAGLTVEMVNYFMGGNAFGKLENGVITFPNSVLAASCVNLSDLYNANTFGKFKVVLPGFAAPASVAESAPVFYQKPDFDRSNCVETIPIPITAGRDKIFIERTDPATVSCKTVSTDRKAREKQDSKTPGTIKACGIPFNGE